MTEWEWKFGHFPQEMLPQVRGRVSARKLRWIACACVRHVESQLFDSRSRRALEVCERFADGLATLDELQTAEQEAFTLANDADLLATYSQPAWAATRAAARACCTDPFLAANEAAHFTIAVFAPWTIDSGGNVLRRGNHADHVMGRFVVADLVREIVGNPYRQIHHDPAWSRWNHGTIPQLARDVYEQQRFGELGILADALEDAGCEERELLDHLRDRDPHVRGCWALDLILGLR